MTGKRTRDRSRSDSDDSDRDERNRERGGRPSRPLLANENERSVGDEYTNAGKRVKRLRRDPSGDPSGRTGGGGRDGSGDGIGRGKSKSRSRVRGSGGDGVRTGGVTDDEDEDEDGEEEAEGEGEDVGVLLGESGVLLGACPEVGCASKADNP